MASKPYTNHPAVFVPVLALLMGAAMWGVVWYPMRLLESSGLSGLWLSLSIYLAALVASLPYTARGWRGAGGHARLLAGIALAAGWTNVAFVLAVLDGNIMRVLLLFYLSPLWAVMLGWLLLGERVSVLSLTTLLLAMGGAMLMLWNPAAGFPWPHDATDWYALTAGMAFATSNVLIRKGQAVSMQAKLGVTWLGVIGVAVALILWHQPPLPVFTPALALGAAAVGVIGIMVMTFLVQYGVTHMPIHRSAVILLFELVAGAISQQLLTDEMMTALEWAGGALIIAAAYVSARA